MLFQMGVTEGDFHKNISCIYAITLYATYLNQKRSCKVLLKNLYCNKIGKKRKNVLVDPTESWKPNQTHRLTDLTIVYENC